MKNALRTIMKRAWEIKKMNVKNIFGLCLKMAWAEFKASKNTPAYIKDWKLREITKDNNGGFLEEIIGVVRETEKAYQLRITWSYSSDISKDISVWVPKSATMTKAEYDAMLAEEDRRFEEGCRKYEDLVAWAKANGIKGVRKGMRKVTILSKIEAAGLKYAM